MGAFFVTNLLGAASTGEVVDSALGTDDTIIEEGASTVRGLEEAVLPAVGVAEVYVDLTVLDLLGGGDAGAHLGDVLAHDEGERLPVAGEDGADGVLGAARAVISNAVDLDSGRVRNIIRRGGDVDGASDSGAGEGGEDGGGGELHVDDCGVFFLLKVSELLDDESE
jgi:hypothetical protein